MSDELQPPPPIVQELADMVGGRIDSHGALPDGSGFATMSMPLPQNHWLTADPDVFDVPPMPLRLGVNDSVIIVINGETKTLSRKDLNEMVRAAGRYAMRCASDRGKINDIDPDALVQNLVVGLLGYHTATGLSSDDWANPKP